MTRTYIGTVGSLVNLPGIDKTSPLSEKPLQRVVVFYKEGETIGVEDVANLYDKHREVELIKIQDRDDMLIMVGTMLTREYGADEAASEIVIMDSSIPIPNRYSHRVSAGYPATAKVTGKRGTGGRRNTKKPAAKQSVQNEDPVKGESGVDPMNPLEEDTKVSTGSGSPVKKN